MDKYHHGIRGIGELLVRKEIIYSYCYSPGIQLLICIYN